MPIRGKVSSHQNKQNHKTHYMHNIILVPYNGNNKETRDDGSAEEAEEGVCRHELSSLLAAIPLIFFVNMLERELFLLETRRSRFHRRTTTRERTEQVYRTVQGREFRGF
jgi:hypothetical protein